MLSPEEREDIVSSWRERGRAILREAEQATERGLLTPAAVADIMADHRGWEHSVQAQGHNDALNGVSRDGNPYGPSDPGHNNWLYGFMLGWSERRTHARV